MESNELRHEKNQSCEQYVCLNEQAGEKKNQSNHGWRKEFHETSYSFYPNAVFAKKAHYIYISSIISSLREIDGVENEFFACPMATAAAVPVDLPFTSVQHRIVGHVAQISQVYEVA